MKNIWGKLPKKVKRYLAITLGVVVFVVVTKTPGWAVPSIILLVVVYELGGFAALVSLLDTSNKDD